MSRVLVKLGGTLLDTPESRQSLTAQIAGLLRDGHRTVVVHGGGKQMTQFLTERGIESRFVNGLRVTTPETMDAVVKVLAGTVNHDLVASFAGAGVQAVGVSGIDAGLVEAVQLDPELGQVGRVTGSNPALLNVLTENGFLPVVACLAGDRSGQMYNVNADQMAVACASAFAADDLVFLTDVDGVRDADGRVLPRLTIADCERLIADGVAAGGMQAKLNAAIAALTQGVERVRIANGKTPDVIRKLLAGETLGTVLTQGG
ncbi:MAG: acetylglutamate kinase [Bryobacterales bacterium]|nr:acetylglutamate kinase [Bryobacterales bacterium]